MESWTTSLRGRAAGPERRQLTCCCSGFALKNTLIGISKRLLLLVLLLSCKLTAATPAPETCPPSSDLRAWAKCADSVRRSGDLERAGQIYLQLFVASRTASHYQAVRTSFLLSDMMDIAAQVPDYRQRLLELVSENESVIRQGNAQLVRYQEWYHLVEELKDDPRTYRIKFFDASVGAGADLLFQLVMFEDLADAHRWETIEDALIAKAKVAVQLLDGPLSIPPAESTHANKRLDAYIKEYSIVEAGLRAVGRDREAENTADGVRQAIARKTYLAAVMTPARVMRQIKLKGARETLHEIRKTKFEELCAGVKSGARAWLEVALMLKQQASTEDSLALHTCIAGALPTHATEIMRAVQIYTPISTEDICTLFSQSAPGERRLALDALASVQEADLQPLAEECSEMIR